MGTGAKVSKITGRRALRPVRAAAVGALALGAALAAGEGCRAPTQVTLVLESSTLSCPDLREVAVVVAADPDDAEGHARRGELTALTTACESDRRVGTLVVTPGAGRGAIVVVAGVNRRASECLSDGYGGCVVARRLFSFVDHVPLTIPIALEVDCLDVPCGARSTCVGKACVSSETPCDESGCRPPGTLPDGGREVVDADAPADAGTTSDAAPGDASIVDASDGAVTDGGLATCNSVCSMSVGAQGPRCAAPAACCPDGDLVMPQLACRTDCGAIRFCCAGKADCSDNALCCLQPGGGTACVPAGTACGTVLCREAADCPGGNDMCNLGQPIGYGMCLSL